MLHFPFARRLAAGLAVLLVATGCDSGPEFQPVADCTPAETMQSAACDNPATPQVETCPTTGLVVEDVRVGTGQAVDLSRVVSIYYTGRLANGTVFDSVTDSTDTGAPLQFPLSQFVTGFALGIAGSDPIPEFGVPQITPMRLGGRRQITIPPNLAYRNSVRERNGTVLIPACSTLIFDVTLVDA